MQKDLQTATNMQAQPRTPPGVYWEAEPFILTLHIPNCHIREVPVGHTAYLERTELSNTTSLEKAKQILKGI